MRRWLSILLLVFMPFQFCWAAAAPYCGHESDALAEHFGHHEHETKQRAAGASEDSKSKSGVAFDVADCHFHCQCMVDLPMAMGMPVVNGANPLADWNASGALAPVLSRPERPQWMGRA